MTRRPRKQSLVLGSVLLFCSMSACDCNDDDLPDDVVKARAKPAVDFGEYQTFRIEDKLTEEDLADAGADLGELPEDVRFNIDTANDQARMELEDLGLTEVGADEEADVLVGSMGSTDDQDAIYWECVPGYWWGYWGWYWDSCAWLDPVYVEYTVGSVMVGVADPAMNDIVFAGFLQGVGDGNGGDDLEHRIRDGVHKMFESWPTTPP